MNVREAFNTVYGARDEIVELAREMISIPSINPPGNELHVANALAKKFRKEKIKVELDILEKGRANLVARLKGAGIAPALLFNGHMDTVPVGDVTWKHDPFGADVIDNQIWGRGAADMKGGLAAMAMAMILAKRKNMELHGDVVLAATAGEETDSCGARFFVENKGMEGVGGVVIAEPSSNNIVIAEKGALWLEVTTYGRTAHGSMPGLGVNAIWKMYDFLSEIKSLKFSKEKDSLLGDCTMSLNILMGGFKENVVPDRCTAVLDCRTISGTKHSEIIEQVHAKLQELAEKDSDFKYELNVKKDTPHVSTPLEDSMVSLACSIASDIWKRDFKPGGVNYYTDATVLVHDTGIPFIILGPGNPGLAHQPNEYVDIDKLIEAAVFYLLFIDKW